MSGVLAVLGALTLLVAWALYGRVIRERLSELSQSLSLLRRRVARMYTPFQSDLAQSLKVSIDDVRFTEPSSTGECRGRVRAVVTNEAVARLERLCVNVRVDSEQCGSFHTAREYYDVKLAPGESAAIEMDIGLLSHTMMRDGYEVHVQVVAAHTVTHEMPTYVLPEACGREVSIREGFVIATDVLVERVALSVRKGVLRSRREVSVTYLVRNDGQAFHQGISLLTRLMSNTGNRLAWSHERFDVVPWGERKVVVKLSLDQVGSGLSSARFAAAFAGLEDFAVGSAFYSQLKSVEGVEEPLEEWHGEEIHGHTWDSRR